MAIRIIPKINVPVVDETAMANLQAAVGQAQATADNARQMATNVRNATTQSIDGIAAQISTLAQTPGQNGDSAYAVWLKAGHTGTVADFIASLKGAPGKDGTNGTNATTVMKRKNVAVPAMLSLLGGAASVDVAITWDTPFADANYTALPSVAIANAGLGGKVTALEKAGTKNAAGVTVTVTTTAILAASTASLDVLGMHP